MIRVGRSWVVCLVRSCPLGDDENKNNSNNNRNKIQCGRVKKGTKNVSKSQINLNLCNVDFEFKPFAACALQSVASPEFLFRDPRWD